MRALPANETQARKCASDLMAAHILEFAGAEGIAATGILVEGYLTGVTRTLIALVGSEAAYATLQRFADAAAVGIVGERAGD